MNAALTLLDSALGREEYAEPLLDTVPVFFLDEVAVVVGAFLC